MTKSDTTISDTALACSLKLRLYTHITPISYLNIGPAIVTSFGRQLTAGVLARVSDYFVQMQLQLFLVSTVVDLCL